MSERSIINPLSQTASSRDVMAAAAHGNGKAMCARIIHDAATSAALRQRAIRAGRLSIIAFHTTPASS